MFAETDIMSYVWIVIGIFVGIVAFRYLNRDR